MSQDWQPIESAPKGQRHFVAEFFGGELCGIGVARKGYVRWVEADEPFKPTHWMPLPAPPNPE